MLLLCGCLLASTATALDEDRFHAHLEALTRAPHRLAGTPEGHRAAAYIESQLKALEGQVLQQRFSFPQQMVDRCELRLGEAVIPLQPLMANGMQPSVTGADGIAGRLAYVGAATWEELDGLDLTGTIAVVDMEAEAALGRLFGLGVRAVIFVGRPNTSRRYARGKRSYISIDLPRFYVGREAAVRHGLLEAGEGTLVSEVRWEKREGRNIFLWLPGANPVFKDEKKEFVLLSTPYDTAGLTPRNSPGHEGAANCAALLEIARELSAQRPRRSVLIAFFDNHANFLEGSRNFYTAWRRGIGERLPDPIPKRQEFVVQERAHITELQVYFAGENLTSQEHPLQEAGMLLLREESKYQYNRYQERLTELRLDIHRRGAAELPTAAAEGGLAQANAGLEQWQLVRESIRDRKPVEAGGRKPFDYMVAQVKERLTVRLGELDALAAQLEESAALAGLVAAANPSAHVALRFSAGNREWLFLPGANLHERLYTSLVENLRQKQEGADEAAAPDFFRGAMAHASAHVAWATHEPTSFAQFFEIPAVTLVTSQDTAPAMGMPDTTIARADLDRIRRQAQQAMVILRQLGNADGASSPNRITRQRRLWIDDYAWNKGQPEGHQVRSFTFGETAANKVEPNVLVHAMNQRNPAGLPDYYVYADANACFKLNPVSPAWERVLLEAAKFGADGRISHLTVANPEGGAGSVAAGWEKAAYYRLKARTGFYSILTMFEGSQGRVFGSLPLGQAFGGSQFRLLNGLSNSKFHHLHFRFDPALGVGFYHVEDPMGVKLIYHDRNNVALFINSQPDKVIGVGYGPGLEGGDTEGDHDLDLRLRSAADLYHLNESRLDKLRQKNIIMNSMEYLHSRAEVMLTNLEGALERRQHAAAAVHAAAATLLEGRIYQPVMDVANDIVKAVTILLLLAIPFAFALQSLLLSTHDVYRKIAGFVFFFFCSFAVLYVVHPAFSFSKTPMVIILAFIIMIMSSVVIWVISGKFNYEVKKLQGFTTTAHNYERRLVGNVGAAVALAISTMKRRPARTLLTVVTVLLLTFTILSFVAFQAERGINRYPLGPGEDQVSRLLLHDRVWQDLPAGFTEEIKRYLETYHGSGYQVHGRYWKAKNFKDADPTEDLYIPVTHASGAAVAGAIMSLDPLELEKLAHLKKILPGDLEAFLAGDGIFLSPQMAAELAAQPGDHVRLLGADLIVLGTFEAKELLNARQLDGAPLLPVNFGMTRMALGDLESKGSAGSGAGISEAQLLQEQLGELEPEALEPVSPDHLIIAPAALRRELGLALKAVLVYPPAPGADLDSLANELGVLHTDGVYVNQGGERRYFHYGDRYGISGTGDVAIPLILGGLIVFSTMLGSIIDREKEIYTFSALGLAPRNIAMLFFVEAGCYAVIGGFGGYLLSQAATRILEVVASFGILKAPEMNYSSSTVINTILTVMATVIVSTIYPAILAARKATADSAGKWRIPEPDGDVLNFIFPFTISQYDITGMMCFICEHFHAHADRTVGRFAAGEAAVCKDEEHGNAALGATIWLQPFDQGVSQRFHLRAAPSDIEEVCEVIVRIERISGPPATWKRSNRVFLEDIRSQFLLWRTQDEETMDHYLDEAGELEKALGILSPDVA